MRSLLLVSLLGDGLGLLERVLLLLQALLVLIGASFNDFATTLRLVSVLLGLVELRIFFIVRSKKNLNLGDRSVEFLGD